MVNRTDASLCALLLLLTGSAAAADDPVAGASEVFVVAYAAIEAGAPLRTCARRDRARDKGREVFRDPALAHAAAAAGQLRDGVHLAPHAGRSAGGARRAARARPARERPVRVRPHDRARFAGRPRRAAETLGGPARQTRTNHRRAAARSQEPASGRERRVARGLDQTLAQLAARGP